MAQQALAAIPNPIKGQSKGLPAFLATLNLGELVIPLAILAIIVALITPMPALLLDFLLAVDIMLSVVVLMVSVHITKPVEFHRLPHHAADVDPLPAGAERLFLAPHPAQRPCSFSAGIEGSQAPMAKV